MARSSTLSRGGLPPSSGTHAAVFDGTRLASGLYLVRMMATPENGAATRTFTERITLLR